MTTWLKALGGTMLAAMVAAGPAVASAARHAARQAPRAATAATAGSGTSFEVLSARAGKLREAGKLAEAITAYEQALQLKPGWTEGRWYVGTLYYELDKPLPARKAFGAVLAAEPGHAGAWAFAGLCEFQLKRYEPALADLMKARELHVGTNKELGSVVRYHAAILLTRFQQFELAQKVLGEFTAEGNDNPKIIEALGISTLRIPLLPEEVPSERREQVLLAGQGTYYLYVHALPAARKSLEELVRRYPDTPNTHYALGVALLNEDPDAGIEELKKELQVSPASVHAMLQIAFEYIKRSDWANARTWAAQAVATAPDNFAGRQAYGQALLELDETAAAIAQLEAGVALAADSPTLHFMLGRAYQKAGRAEDAARERQKFVTLNQGARSRDQGAQSVGGVQSTSPPATSAPPAAAPPAPASPPAPATPPPPPQ
jgi:tetratricopeptide (TPR) repeat protein